MGQSINSSKFDLDNVDDFDGIAEIPDALNSDRLFENQNRSMADNVRKSEMMDFNKLSKINKGQISKVQGSVRASEVSPDRKSGLDSSIAMSNHIKDFKDFGFDDESEKSKLVL